MDINWLGNYYYAHRGLHDNKSAPENSLLAFKKAVDNGFGIELDTYLNTNGQLVVHHDYTLRRMCNRRVLITSVTSKNRDNYTLLSTSEKIPLLSEVLQLVDGKVPIIIEIKCHNKKHSAVSAAVAALLKDYNGLFCIESFNPKVVHWFKNNAPKIVRGQLSDFVRGRIVPDMIRRKKLAYFNQSNPHFIAYNINYLPNKFVSKALAARPETKVVTWTIKTPAQFNHAKSHSDALIFETIDPISLEAAFNVAEDKNV